MGTENNPNEWECAWLLFPVLADHLCPLRLRCLLINIQQNHRNGPNDPPPPQSGSFRFKAFILGTADSGARLKIAPAVPSSHKDARSPTLAQMEKVITGVSRGEGGVGTAAQGNLAHETNIEK